MRAQIAASRALCESGSGRWFGAFEDGALRAALGIVADGDGLARYQMVETHPEARRRGLATLSRAPRRDHRPGRRGDDPRDPRRPGIPRDRRLPVAGVRRTGDEGRAHTPDSRPGERTLDSGRAGLRRTRDRCGAGGIVDRDVPRARRRARAPRRQGAVPPRQALRWRPHGAGAQADPGGSVARRRARRRQVRAAAPLWGALRADARRAADPDDAAPATRRVPRRSRRGRRRRSPRRCPRRGGRDRRLRRYRPDRR